jgi:outer membrane protein assembly factor BamD (BamD/ComL family)
MRTPLLRAVVARAWAPVAFGAWAALTGGCQTAPPAGSARATSPDPAIVQAKAEAKAAAEGDTSDPPPTWWSKIDPFAPPPAPPPPADSFVLRAEGLVPEPPPKEGGAQAKLAGAHELFRQGEYAKAEKLFRHIAEDTRKTPAPVAGEARYFEGECLRLQGRYPKAADVFADAASSEKYPQNPYREQAMQHMYDIANFWLDPTREEMREWRERQEGKRWFVWPHFLSIEKERPFMDGEGRALEKLEQVRYDDINGPLADRALFLAGSVKFFNEDYQGADFCFSQIHEKHPNSPLAAQAVELAIVSKHLSTGGSVYDGRKVAEARKLVQSAFDNYPELATKKEDFLKRQLYGITMQQAEKDYKMAEFWKKTGHPGSAYFYFELVRRRYPNTPYAEKAGRQMAELQEKARKDGAVFVGPQSGRPAEPSKPAAVAPADPPRPLPPEVENAPPRPVVPGQGP